MHSSTYLDADSKASHFNVIKTRRGIAQFLSLDELKDPCDGCFFFLSIKNKYIDKETQKEGSKTYT